MEETYHSYFDLSNGIQLLQTYDPRIVCQDKRLYLGKNLTDADIIAILRSGIVIAQ